MKVITLPPPPVNRQEILRYASCPKEMASSLPLEDCLRLAEEQISCRVCWERCPLHISGEQVDMGFATVRSAGLAKALEGCSSVLIFAATVGLGIDRLILRYERVSPLWALTLHAIGAERIESLCDAFCGEFSRELAADGETLRPRYSPGYGDLPLAFQQDLFRALDCERRIGLTLTQGLAMSPAKSVTAIAGIGMGFCGTRKAGRASCDLKDCAFRRS